MKPIFTILAWEYLSRLRSKLFLFSTIILPVIILGSIMLPAALAEKEGQEVTSIGLVDFSPVGDAFQANLTSDYRLATGEVRFRVIKFYTVEQARKALQERDIHGYLVLESNVVETNQARYYTRSASNYKVTSNLNAALNKTVVRYRLQESNLDPNLITDLTKRVNLDIYEVSRRGEATSSDELMGFMVPFLFVMLLYLPIVLSAQILMRSVLEERNTRMMEVLLSSVSPRQLMMGKILGLGSVGVTQLVFYLLIGYVITIQKGMSVFTVDSLGSFLLYFLTGYFFYATIFATVGSLFTSEQEAQQVVGMVTIVMIIPVILATFFITNPNSLATKVLSFLPPITPFLMILRVGTKSVALWEIIATTLLMLACIVVMFRLAGRIFQTAVLLYGKRVTLPEIVRWMKGA
ncbi:MAG: ABC transporter permease [Fidelibacterota bacterium]